MRHYSNDFSTCRRDAAELHPCIATENVVTKSFFTKWRKVIFGLLLFVVVVSIIAVLAFHFLLRVEHDEGDILYVHYDIEPDPPILYHDTQSSDTLDDRESSVSRSGSMSYQIELKRPISLTKKDLEWSSRELADGTRIEPLLRYSTAVIEEPSDRIVTTEAMELVTTSTEADVFRGFVNSDDQKSSFHSMSNAVKADCSAHIDARTGSGTYLVSPDGDEPFLVYCDQVTSGGGWTVIQRRDSASIYFYNRTWQEYEQGFGYIGGSHWLGLFKIHRLAPRSMEKWTLRIELHGDTCIGNGCIGQSNGFWWAEWPFRLGDSLSLYVLEIGSAIRGNLTGSTDFLMENNGCPFTTIDRDNDAVGVNCAQFRNFGGWWHGGCGHVALNGIYGDTLPSHRYMVYTYSSSRTRRRRYFIHPKKSIMMIRPSSFE